MKASSSWLLLIFLALIWGSSFWLIKQGLLHFSALQVALLRIIISALCLLPFVVFRPKNIHYPWRWLMVVGLVGSLIPALLFATAQQVIHSALAGMLNTLQPLFTLIIAALAYHQKIPRQHIWGLLTGFAGSILLLSSSAEHIHWLQHIGFSALVILATLCYGFSTNIIRHHCSEVPPKQISALSLNIFLLPSVILLLLLDPITQTAITRSFILSATSIILLGAVGTALALIVFNHLIKASGPIWASMVTYLIPIVATFWGWLEAEPISWMHLLGMLVILIGVYLCSGARRTTSTHSTSVEKSTQSR